MSRRSHRGLFSYLKLSTACVAAALSVAVSGIQNGPAVTQAAFVPDLPIPADAGTRGMWSTVGNWPLITVHAVLMPDGRVLSYGTDSTGKQTGFFIYDVWDPSNGTIAGGHTTLPNGTNTDIFCGSQVVLPDGSGVFLAGGDNWTGTGTTNTGNNNSNFYNLTDSSLTRGSNMNRARWYSGSTVLLNGEVYIQGGSSGTDLPEIRSTNGSFRLLSTANTSGFDFMYPRNFIAPDGRVFGYDSAGRMYYVDTSGTGSITQVGTLPSANTGSDASAAMFQPGKILQFGGNSNGAVVIDITGGAPVVTATQSMSSQRRLVNATVLPNGKVLATGGSQVWNALTGVNNIAEIWDPATGTWLQGASGDRARLYHSNALLLPDATVLVSGGGAPGPQNNTNAEIYFPPYLFTASGTLASRPAIASAPAAIEIGSTFFVDLAAANGVSRIALIKAGSATHSWNMEQRFNELSFSLSGSRLAIQAPTKATDAPPGFYQLFVLDSAGVPSIAKMIKVGVAANPNPAVVPTIANPGNQNSTTGIAVSLQLVGADPNGDAIGFAAAGLPPGLTLDTTTGRISGTPTAPGTYNVIIGVSDGYNSATTSFTWTVTGQATALSLDPLPTLPAVLRGATATYTARAVGTNVRYQWSFSDGTPDSAWSSSPTISKSFVNPGIYYVTVRATDDSAIQQSQVAVQSVYLPATAGKPSASTNLLFETRSGATSRLWVVNQDNDSVSVFDIVTGAKLAEISVGASPRSAALRNGEVWVTNKRGASISVISTGTLAVTRTVALARAAQPFGIVFSPDGANAFVALEALGQVVKINTSTSTVTATATVGDNPRQLSITGDGATLYVARFITAPLPGEATAAVSTTNAGGELAVLATATMTSSARVVLQVSSKPDTEAQGRGVPNYLGAAAISPDGTQAWVPSKQDNVQRGSLRDGRNLDFQNTVRAISSRIDLATQTEDPAARIDHDNASVASAAVFDRLGVYLFVALETSREVAVVNAHSQFEVFRFAVGRAPQGLVVSPDGLTLYVNNFMDRTVEGYDLRPLIQNGDVSVPRAASVATVATEKLTPQVLAGKQLFYDARDPRVARDRYMSCASCHSDGGHDGRVWDLTGMGEGLRNTINLRGRAGMGQGFLHWSNNFDEVQDFEGQIRALSGGTGLMADADFNAGTRSQPLGTTKAGLSADLDALAAYVASLSSFDQSPYRRTDGSLTSTAQQGRVVFTNLNCGSCHAGTAFTNSGANTLSNIGTIKPSSGQRLGGPLTGIDVPTLRDVWATAPYLHDGSAATLEAAVRAHTGVTISDTDLATLTDFLKQVGSEETSAPVPAVGTGTGLLGQYFNNRTLSGAPALTRVEAVNFNWGNSAPGVGVGADNFSVRWTGFVVPTVSGSYQFQTRSDDGVRLWVNGAALINNWTDHSATNNTSATVNLVAGTKYPITMEFYENGGQAVAMLRWRVPGSSSYVAIPAARLFSN